MSRIISEQYQGKSPAVALINPKYPDNFRSVIRAAACYDVKQVWITGKRIIQDPKRLERIPREERLKQYSSVELINYDKFLDCFDKNITPVAVEFRENSESLPNFIHPENPLYIFGPEDGSIPQNILSHCHRFVIIPTRYCINLAAAVYTILYDRKCKEGTKS